MTYLVDTVVLSEMRRSQRDPGVVAWLQACETKDIFISAITIGEITRGISLQESKDPEFAASLNRWKGQVVALYNDNILDFTMKAAVIWGDLSAKIGNSSAGLQIAATALENDLIIATRNVRHFEPTGAKIFNPWRQV